MKKLSQQHAHKQRSNIFKTKCTVKGYVCDLIIDGVSNENIVSSLMVKKLNLPTEKHPNPHGKETKLKV